MNEIGLELKAKREANGVSIDEAATDLKVKPKDIMNLEASKKDEFKDVLFLKNLIRDYAKYLGLDSDKMLDKFNEFLFDFTSKIPVTAIEQAKKEKKEDKKIGSPYTMTTEKKKTGKMVGIIVMILVIAIVIGVVVSKVFFGSKMNDNVITYVVGR